MQRDRSEEAAEKLQIEVHQAVDIFEQSIKDSLLGRSAMTSSQSKLGKRKYGVGGNDDDDEKVAIGNDDDDDFYDRTTRKPAKARTTTSKHGDANSGDKGVLETAETLWEKKYTMEEKLARLDADLAAARRAEADTTKGTQAGAQETTDVQEEEEEEEEEEDEFEKFMKANNAALQRQQPVTTSHENRDTATHSTAALETEIEESKRALARVIKLLAYADPLHEFKPPVRHQTHT